jgi:hypothetical protein
MKIFDNQKYNFQVHDIELEALFSKLSRISYVSKMVYA